MCRQVGVPRIVVFLNQFGTDDDTEFLTTLETEVGELLTTHGYSGDDTPIITGSAQMARDDEDTAAVKKLNEIMDSYIPVPVHPMNRPCLLAIEDVQASPDGGAIVTGRVDRGTIKAQDEVEVVGLSRTAVAKCKSVEISRQPCDQGRAGQDCSLLLSGIASSDVSIPLQSLLIQMLTYFL